MAPAAEDALTVFEAPSMPRHIAQATRSGKDADTTQTLEDGLLSAEVPGK